MKEISSQGAWTCDCASGSPPGYGSGPAAAATIQCLWERQDWINPALDFSQVSCHAVEDHGLCSGVVRVEADAVPEERQTAVRLVPHGSVVFVQTECGRQGHAETCLYREQTQGPEAHQLLFDASCKVLMLLGDKVPLSAELLKRDPSELMLSLRSEDMTDYELRLQAVERALGLRP